MLAITRTSTGGANIYIDGVLSGTANQSSGTPVAGSTNTLIGGNASNYGHKGLIPSIRILNGILTAQEIAQMFSNEKDKYGL